MWIFDTVSRAWRLLNSEGGDANKAPSQISPYIAMGFSPDDDLFMLLGGIGDGVTTWFFDVYMNTWYRTTVPWGTTMAEAGVTYDTKKKKYIKFGGVNQLRDLWIYDSAAGSWTIAPGWNQTYLAAPVHRGDTTITVANAAAAQAGGSVVIRRDIGFVDQLCSEGPYSYIPLDITGVKGNVISISQASNPYAAYSVVLTADLSKLTAQQRDQYLGLYFYTYDTGGTTVTMWGRKINKAQLEALSFVSSVKEIPNPGVLGYENPIPAGNTILVDIYPPGWPPYALAGSSSEGSIDPGAGPSICTQMGIEGAVYDDINHKHLYFIPRRDSNNISVWAYDLTTHIWEHKTSSPDMEGHRLGDIQAGWMHQNDAVILLDLGTAKGSGVSTKVKYYRYATGSVAIETPDNLAATVNSRSIGLTWDGVSGATGYYVYRANPRSGIDPRGLFYTKVASRGCRGLITRTSCTDATVQRDKAYHYRVTAYNGSVESAFSSVARGVPHLIWDGYVSLNSMKSQTAHWTPRDTNVDGYNVYRADCKATYYPQGTYSVSTGWTQYSRNIYRRQLSTDTEDASGVYPVKTMTDVNTSTKFTDVSYVASIDGPYKYAQDGNWLYANINGQSPPTDTVRYTLGPMYSDFLYTDSTLRFCVPGSFTKLNSSLITGTSYADTADMAGEKQYAYRVTSVNKLGIESGPSPFWITIPREVRHLNWRTSPAEGSLTSGSYTVKLKWDDNPEANLQGYHVYRKAGNGKDGNGNYLVRLTSSPIRSTEYIDTLPYNYTNTGYYVVAIDSLGQEGIPSSRALVNRSSLKFWTSQGYLTDYNSGVDFGPP